MRHADSLDRLRRDGLLRTARTATPLPNGRCRIDGRDLWNFTTNDYLDLAADPRLVEAAKQALDECGVGARASALVSGRSEWHERLEARIAAFEGTEAAILFPTGYAANVGTLAALLDGDGVAYCDRLNHASLVDGCRASGAALRVYRHDDLGKLERELAKRDVAHTSGVRRGALDGDEGTHAHQRCAPQHVVTDGVFSMDGDLAPLREMCDLAERYDATLIVDEAHGTGVFGEHGRGACEYLGVEDRVAVRIGTLSKAVGCLGGFVAGDRTLIEWLRNTARTQIYSTALPPAICAAASVAFDVIEMEPERRATLLDRVAFLRARLRDCGVVVAADGMGPIVPVIVGEAERVVAIGRRLEERGFLVGTIRPPTVPKGTSRLRISITVAHGETALDELAIATAAAIGDTTE